MPKKGEKVKHYIDGRPIFHGKKYRGIKLDDHPGHYYNKIHFDNGYTVLIEINHKQYWVQKKYIVIARSSKMIYFQPDYYKKMFECSDDSELFTVKDLKIKLYGQDNSSNQRGSKFRLDETLTSTINGRGKSDSILRPKQRRKRLR